MKVRDPNYPKKIDEIFRKAAFMMDLGAEVERVEPGFCVSRLRVMPRFLQQDKFIHAAVQAALADHTAGGAGCTLVEPDETVLTIEYKINLLRPAIGQMLRANAKVIRPGQRITIVESDVFAIGAAGLEQQTAKAIVTLAVVKLNEGVAEEKVETVSTREGYDRWAEIYDGEDNPLVALEEREIDRVLGDVRGLAIVDLGCGTGRHTLRLAERGAHVTGIDFSSGMLEKAREKTAHLDVNPELVVHDISTRLPFEDASFDRVLSALVLDHIENLAGFFSEMQRIVKPRGRVVVTVMHPAMMLRGVEARFRDPRTGREIRPKSAGHQISDYVAAASAAGLRIELCKEHIVDEALAERLPRARKYLHWPMLLMMSLERAS
jgi:malonyl-CoA O-methyltransferase